MATHPKEKKMKISPTIYEDIGKEMKRKSTKKRKARDSRKK